MTSRLKLSFDDIHAMSEVMQDCFRMRRELILSRAGKTSFTDKQDGSPVTLTDKEVEDAIILQFKASFPMVAIFGEESGYSTDLSGTFWLIDPIDGTSNFIANIPTFTSMGVLVHDGISVASIIFNPSTEDMYVAFKDEGAFKNGRKLDLSTTPLSHSAFSKGRHLEILDELLSSFAVKTEIAPNGAGYGFSAVAVGQVAARFQLHSRGGIHDYAPGALLVLEAGGAIVPILEEKYTYATKSFVACHPLLQETMLLSRDRLRELER